MKTCSASVFLSIFVSVFLSALVSVFVSVFIYVFVSVLVSVFVSVLITAMKKTWQSDDADKCGGKFKKFYEDFHRAKTLIAFLSQKTASHVYLFQPPPLPFQNSNKTSVSQVMFKGFTEKVGKIIWISWCKDMSWHSDLQISWSPETEMSSCLSFSNLFISGYKNVIRWLCSGCANM